MANFIRDFDAGKVKLAQEKEVGRRSHAPLLWSAGRGHMSPPGSFAFLSLEWLPRPPCVPLLRFPGDRPAGTPPSVSSILPCPYWVTAGASEVPQCALPTQASLTLHLAPPVQPPPCPPRAVRCQKAAKLAARAAKPPAPALKARSQTVRGVNVRGRRSSREHLDVEPGALAALAALGPAKGRRMSREAIDVVGAVEGAAPVRGTVCVCSAAAWGCACGLACMSHLVGVACARRCACFHLGALTVSAFPCPRAHACVSPCVYDFHFLLLQGRPRRMSREQAAPGEAAELDPAAAAAAAALAADTSQPPLNRMAGIMRRCMHAWVPLCASVVLLEVHGRVRASLACGVVGAECWWLAGVFDATTVPSTPSSQHARRPAAVALHASRHATATRHRPVQRRG